MYALHTRIHTHTHTTHTYKHTLSLTDIPDAVVHGHRKGRLQVPQHRERGHTNVVHALERREEIEAKQQRDGHPLDGDGGAGSERAFGEGQEEYDGRDRLEDEQDPGVRVRAHHGLVEYDHANGRAGKHKAWYDGLRI